MHKSKGITWTRDMKKLCKQYNLMYLWNDNVIVNKNTTMSIVKKRVWDYHLYLIRDRLCGGKADFYNGLSTAIVRGATPWYLHHIDLKNISVLFNFRSRCHRLLIDKGAWMGLERANRICLCCGDRDDEMHFLFNCRLYLCNRARYIPTQYHGSKSHLDVYRLLLTQDKKVINNVCVFIRKGLKVHSNCYKNIVFKNTDVIMLKDAIFNNNNQ